MVVELEFGNVAFCGGRKTLGATTNPTHIWRRARIEPGSHQLKASVLTTAPSLLSKSSISNTRERAVPHFHTPRKELTIRLTDEYRVLRGVWKSSKHCSECLIYRPFSPDRSQLGSALPPVNLRVYWTSQRKVI